METDATNPVGGEDTAAEATLETEAGVEAEGQTDEPQYDDDGNLIEPEPEDEEVEFDEDLKLKVPKTHAQKVREALLRQADYTRKTQAHAENVRAFETERAQYVQASNAEIEAFAVVRSLQAQLASYQNRNFAAELAQANANYDDEAARAIQAQHIHSQQLRDALQGAMGQLGAARNQRLSMEQQETARRIEQGREILAREIGWNDELKAKLTDYALSKGLSRDDLSDLEANPAAAKILRDAFQWQEHSRKATAANRHVQAQQAQPAAKVSTATPPASSRPEDRDSIGTWMEKRNKQVRSKAA